MFLGLMITAILSHQSISSLNIYAMIGRLVIMKFCLYESVRHNFILNICRVYVGCTALSPGNLSQDSICLFDSTLRMCDKLRVPAMS